MIRKLLSLALRPVVIWLFWDDCWKGGHGFRALQERQEVKRRP